MMKQASFAGVGERVTHLLGIQYFQETGGHET